MYMYKDMCINQAVISRQESL